MPHDAAALGDPTASWPAPVAEQLAGLAKECVRPEIASRPTIQAVAERLAPLVAESDPGRHEPPGRECIMCMGAERRTRLRPCCHVVYCEPCCEEALVTQLDCPLCRSPVEGYDLGDFHATFAPQGRSASRPNRL